MEIIFPALDYLRAWFEDEKVCRVRSDVASVPFLCKEIARHLEKSKNFQSSNSKNCNNQAMNPKHAIVIIALFEIL